MGSRRDNRSSVVGPTLHTKHHHEKRNHELLKRLASDTPSSYPMSESTTTAKTSSRAGVPIMSKSLTLEIGGKGGHHLDSGGKPRPRKKSDVEKSLKSIQRNTSSSAMKMSNSLNDKDSFSDNRTSRIMRDQSPAKGKGHNVREAVQSSKTTRKRSTTAGKPSNPVGHHADKKGGPAGGENVKKGDVFDRLSRQDCNNRGITRSEHGPGNRIRDRSPTKTGGRKSPQEKNAASDKHLTTSRKTSAPAQSRRRDVSPEKRGEDAGKRIISSSRGSLGRRKITRERISGSNHNLEDKDSSREKLEKDNVPESLDKDLEDLAVSDDVDCNMTASAPGVLLSKAISSNSTSTSTSPHQDEIGVGGERGRGGGRLDATTKGALSPKTTRHSTSEDAVTSIVMTSQASKNSPKVENSKKSDANGVVLKGTKTSPSNVSEKHSNTPRRPATSKDVQAVLAPPPELSKADVMQKVRQRVQDESTRSVKNAVVDDDKDVCESEKCEEDDFYKIKVQTRLVSYSNSTLVIKNTSKGASVGEPTSAGQNRDTEVSDSSHSPLHHPHNTLQTSSMPSPSAQCSADVEADCAHALPTEVRREEEEQEQEQEHAEEEGEEDGSSLVTRSRSMRLKFNQFVCKGKNFLTDVYSATQSKLEQYTRTEIPSATAQASLRSAEDETETTNSRAARPDDSESGYYSISASPEVMQSVVVSSPRDNTCDVAGRVDTPENGTDDDAGANATNAMNAVPAEETCNVHEDDDDVDALPSIPQPHVNFKLNEDWIKKNILCTCKCKRNSDRLRTQTELNSSTSNLSQISFDKLLSQSTDDTVIEKPNCTDTGSSVSVETDSVSTGGPLEPSDSSPEVTADTTKALDELCLCSCHDGDDDQRLQQFPQEVKELLDADHARMWWTITGNFGNILPIDWSKTYTRQQYLPVLNLNEAKAMTNATEEADRSADDDAEEEEVAQDLDLHHLILNGLSAEPVKSAEEVIREIDDIMQEGSSSEDEGAEETSSSAANSNEPTTHPLPPPLYAEKLNNMSIGELNESFMELEVVIRQYSETLINQLALRDELEYEKELKNSFISLLLQVQNKRRNFNVEKKKQKKVGPNGIDPKYLTTVIPYDVGHGPPQNETLQILIKILMAINEDSPTVPTLLTDYILKVLCPS